MSETVWLKRSPEWIKANPGKGTMYKALPNGEPVEALQALNGAARGRITKKKQDSTDRGIYVIICEPSKSAYVGQSINMGTRMRSHKMSILTETYTNSRCYDRMKEDRDKYGMEVFEFKRHIYIPESDERDITDIENSTMYDFINKGYNLYNISIPGNLICPDELVGLIHEVIKATSKNPDLKEKLKALIA